MTRFQQILLRPSGQLPAGDLRRCREHTLDLARRGWRVPVLLGHAPSGAPAGGPRVSSDRLQPVAWSAQQAISDAATPGMKFHGSAGASPSQPSASPSQARRVGWLVDLVELPDGALAQVLQIDDPHTALEIAAGRLRFSSPELRPRLLLDDGDQAGPLIAHIALTQHPLCSGQTPLAAAPIDHEPFSQFPPQGDPIVSTLQELVARPLDQRATQSPEPPQSDADHSDEAPPPQSLPPREQPETDEAPDRNRSRQTSGADANAAGTLASSDNGQVSDLPHKPPIDVFAHRARLAERIRLSRVLPKGLRDRLCERVETVQLSGDAQATPVIPVAEAVEMIEAALPEHVQLAPDHLESPPHPHGEGFFTGGIRELSDEEARRIAAEQLAASGFGPAT